MLDIHLYLVEERDLDYVVKMVRLTAHAILGIYYFPDSAINYILLCGHFSFGLLKIKTYDAI